MLPHFLSQTACLGKLTSSCSAAPAKPTMSPAVSLQQETPQQCISCRCASLSMQLLNDSQNHWNVIILGPAILQETHLTF